MATIPSPLKWSGSKRHLAPKLAELFPNSYDLVIDPFIGGGNMIPYYKAPVMASDICAPLIDLWNVIKGDPAGVAESYFLDNYFFKEDHGYYYEVRHEFNITKDPCDFLFLLRTCVNGLVRFNSKGEFNSPVHNNRDGIDPATLTEIIHKWSETYLKDVRFTCCDYSCALELATKDSFIFLDPPYMGSAAMYQGNFDFPRLFDTLEALNNKGCRWMMTFDSSESTEELRYKELELRLGAKKLFLDSPSSSFYRLTGSSKNVTESVYVNY